jgi:hypothetical protein
MTTSPFAADSLLVVDVGELTTRALLFDVVDGRYRFLAAGSAHTTLSAPYYDLSEGVRLAMDDLQEITGRVILGSDERLIIPTLASGSGVDSFAAILSAGAPLDVVVVGLLEDLSVESARRLAATTYTRVAKTFSLNDRLKPEARIDAIMQLRPDAILIAGGTDHGASRSVMRLAEIIGLACRLFPEGHVPEVLYAGNQALGEQIKAALDLPALHIAPNVRPTVENEQIPAAQVKLTEIFRRLRVRQMAGVNNLNTWAAGHLLPSATAFGRVIQFLSEYYDPTKGVLGLEVGESATTAAASFAGKLSLGVYPELGLSHALANLLEQTSLTEIGRWLPMDVSADTLRDAIHNKCLLPATLPITVEDLAIEQALMREVIRLTLRRVGKGFPSGVKGSKDGLLPWFEPIIAAGNWLTRLPSAGQRLLTLLDAIQPTGVTTLVLDQNNLTASLGAAATLNPVLTVQVLESSNYLNLGTVISPVADARPGAPILRVRVQYENGEETAIDVKQGTLEMIRLPLGQAAQLQLQPFHRAEVGMGGAGRGGKVRVVGGTLGVVIDARGRPLALPSDPARRRELMKKWLWSLGG